MAEFPQLGVRCEFNTCQQLDFLPFLCNECSGTFCLKHRTKASHGCSVDSKQENKGSLAKVQEKSGMQCAFDECKSFELMPVVCKHCHYNHCLRHRHQVDHQCSALPQKDSRGSPQELERIQQIIGKDVGKEKQGRGGMRNEIRAAKVSLMRLKCKATGDNSIPQDERIYLRVLLPCGSKEQEVAMFFSKYWTVGKIIDKIAVAARLQNDNNLNTGEKKLRLIHRRTGEVLGLHVQFEHYQKENDCPLLNGSAVIIEYVDMDCTSLLPHLDKYLT
ncbi:AN1-type zinc finger protein 1-like isoform X1 [Montipora capricornis]|uniref:AN1-type zinc finger protein 1-like isoform X1 n=1 Tax=Montipora capricornis TaxID=246305 RepID=UPI0035F1E67E